MSRERSARWLYRLHLGVAALGAGLVAGTIVVVVAGVDLRLPSSESIVAACGRGLSALRPGAVLVLALGVLALSSVVRGARSAWRQLAASRRYMDRLPISEAAVSVDEARCQVIETSRVLALCAGYLRPRVYVSRGAVEELSRDELRAVVGHELHHVRRRDPLLLLLARSLADAMFFVPLLRRTGERCAALGELAADEAAVRRLDGERPPLASALLKFSAPADHPASVAGIAPERVDHLMGDPGAGRWQLPRSRAHGSGVVLAALAGLLAASAEGLLAVDLDLPTLVTAACMVAMIGGPVALALGAVMMSRHALRARAG